MVGLDPAAIKMLKDVVLKLRDNGATVLISTHMLEIGRASCRERVSSTV